MIRNKIESVTPNNEHVLCTSEDIFGGTVTRIRKNLSYSGNLVLSSKSYDFFICDRFLYRQLVFTVSVICGIHI